jgi:hypothetical protein
MTVAVVRLHCGVNKLIFHFVNLKASASSRANSSFLERWEWLCVHGWKMRHRKDCQWCCGEGEGHVVIQPPHKSLAVRRRPSSKSAKGDVDILRSR